MPSYSQFAPQYIQESELNLFGLPTPDVQTDILSLIEMASLIVDEECGRIDGDGNGSLVYTTWVHRCLLGQRNLLECPMKPLAVVDADTVAALQAVASASGECNHVYTGVQPNTIVSTLTNSLSPILACSGRYGYERTAQTGASNYFGLAAFTNPLNLITMLGGPAPWVAVDVATIDYDSRTGELWLPVGLQARRYSEVVLTYNAGFNPMAIPRTVKHVVASVVKNAMASGDATTFLMGMTLGKAGANFTFRGSIMDPTLATMLTPFRNVRSY